MVAELDLATTPAAPPPPGVTSNLINPPTEFRVLLATCIIAWSFTVPAVVIRLFTKLRVHGRLQYEDCECSSISYPFFIDLHVQMS